MMLGLSLDAACVGWRGAALTKCWTRLFNFRTEQREADKMRVWLCVHVIDTPANATKGSLQVAGLTSMQHA